MPRYEVVLFDADHTLFDFDRAEREALRQTLEEAGLPADGETEARYLSINRALWNRLDRGEVRREWLVVERFAALLRALGGREMPRPSTGPTWTTWGRAPTSCRGLRRCAAPWPPLHPGHCHQRRGPRPAPPLRGIPPERPHPLAVYFGGAGGQQARLRLFCPGAPYTGESRPPPGADGGGQPPGRYPGGHPGRAGHGLYNPGRLPGDPAIVPTWEVDGYAALQALILKEEKNNI